MLQRENIVTDKPFFVILAHFWASNNFSKKFASINQANHQKNAEVTGDQINWTILAHFQPRHQDIWGHFGLFSGKQESFQKT